MTDRKHRFQDAATTIVNAGDTFVCDVMPHSQR